MITKDEIDAIIDGVAPVIREYVAIEIGNIPAPAKGDKGDRGDQGPPPDAETMQKVMDYFAAGFMKGFGDE